MIADFCSHHLPDFLCRACHPELRVSVADRRALDAAERARREAENEARRRRQDLLRTQQRIASMTMHGEPQGISATVLAALRRKAERLAA